MSYIFYGYDTIVASFFYFLKVARSIWEMEQICNTHLHNYETTQKD